MTSQAMLTIFKEKVLHVALLAKDSNIRFEVVAVNLA